MNLNIFSQDVINTLNKNQIILGPHRVLPGRLSVSRSFGDVEAKLPKSGGNPNVVTAIPDIISFKIDSTLDFITLGCDGIYDQLSDQDVAQCFWMTMKDSLKAQNLHLQCGMAVDMIIKTSLVRKSLDNVTCVFIAFDNLERVFNKSSDTEIIEKTNSDKAKPDVFNKLTYNQLYTDSTK
jgi:protein phosphatase 2C family protein 2/3